MPDRQRRSAASGRCGTEHAASLFAVRGLDQTALQELKARSGNLRTSLQGLVRDTQLSVLTGHENEPTVSETAPRASVKTHSLVTLAPRRHVFEA